MRVLSELVAIHGRPTALRMGNGPEFISNALDAWAYHHHVQLVFIDPGKPIQNAHVDSFNGKVRDEFLNEHWFLSIHEAQVLAEAFRIDFNTVATQLVEQPDAGGICEVVGGLTGCAGSPARPRARTNCGGSHIEQLELAENGDCGARRVLERRVSQ